MARIEERGEGGMRRAVFAVGAVLLVLAACASASAKTPKDPTIIARNILPSGQYGVPNPNAATQAEMYNALTPLFDRVTPADLFTDFKSEKLGIDTDGPVTVERVPVESRRRAGFSPRTAACSWSRLASTHASPSSMRRV
jgi:ABC-type oligopeptide transport system substrate-binding subunit